MAGGSYLTILALEELPYAVGTAFVGESILEQRVLMLLGLGALAIFFSAGPSSSSTGASAPLKTPQ